MLREEVMQLQDSQNQGFAKGESVETQRTGNRDELGVGMQGRVCKAEQCRSLWRFTDSGSVSNKVILTSMLGSKSCLTAITPEQLAEIFIHCS